MFTGDWAGALFFDGGLGEVFEGVPVLAYCGAKGEPEREPRKCPGPRGLAAPRKAQRRTHNHSLERPT